MRAVVISEFGGPEVLTLTDVPVPEPGPGQVLLRVEASAVSVGETEMRAGKYPLPLPMIMGAETTGIVTKLGADVDPTLMGQRVVAITGGRGAYAEFVAVDVAKTARIPDNVTARDAVASAAQGALALALLHRAGLTGGETVLVEGGSGKVGGYLVRHAREFGAGRVVATASKRPAADADLVVDHGNPQWMDEVEPVDVVFDMRAAGRLLPKVRPGGKVLMYGSSDLPLDADVIRQQGLTVIGCGGPRWFEQCVGVHYPEFLGRLSDKSTYVQPVEAVLPLEEAAEAHELVLTGVGRVLLSPVGTGSRTS
jgi:NADPH2:quinone reductase